MQNRNITILLRTLTLLTAGLAFPPLIRATDLDGVLPGGNNAVGVNALTSLTTGTFNTAVGLFSLGGNTTGSENTAIGAGALLLNTEGQNTAIGAGALLSNTTGSANMAAGVHALFNNTIGHDNTANGAAALQSNTTGNNNTAIGSHALLNSGRNGNIAIGSFAGTGISDAENAICIGTPGLNESDRCFIGNIFNTDLPGGNAVFINANGKLGLILSSQRFKDEIKPMKQASNLIYALKPVTFRYKSEIDPDGILQFGLVAEEVEKVNPNLVGRDQDGKPYTVHYEQINAMLLNEFLKEHRKVHDLEKAVLALTAQLKAQAAQIQKVSAHLEMSLPRTRFVLDNP